MTALWLPSEKNVLISIQNIKHSPQYFSTKRRNLLFAEKPQNH